MATWLPERTVTTVELEETIAQLSLGVRIPRGLIERASGVRRRHLADPEQMPSDLAVAAARKLFEQTGHTPGDLDLILYAGISTDTVEPAAAHVVAAKLGADCAVFDVRNACNGVLNALEIADAFITGGHYRRILITCGEVLTPWSSRQVTTVEDFIAASASHTVSDAGAALLVQASPVAGILGHRFVAYSANWQAAAVFAARTVAGEYRPTPFTVDALQLLEAFDRLDLKALQQPLIEQGLDWADMAAVCVHQAALPYLWTFCDNVGIPRDKVVVTIADHGNVASASLPLQLAQATRTGRVKAGDLVALVGLAGGVSAGTMLLRW
ncbi:3-oxoacyl-ACP synthase III family protein [Spirillospora sp. CA-253888]